MALERQAVAGQTQVAELRSQLREREHLGLFADSRLVQGDLRAGVREVRVGIGSDQQERLRPEPAGTDAGDVGEQLVAAEAERPDDPRRKRIAREMSGCERHRQLFSKPPTMPPSRSPPPSRCALPPEPSATGGWK